MVDRFMRRVLAFVVVCALGFGCSQEEEGKHSTHPAMETSETTTNASAEISHLNIQVPEDYQAGEERFNALCSRCHGVHARGTDQGPPLVHKIYEPSHHGDFAFLRAAAQGVRAHHWDFGNMPKIAEASPDDVQLIIQYVRWLQREAGIH